MMTQLDAFSHGIILLIISKQVLSLVLQDDVGILFLIVILWAIANELGWLQKWIGEAGNKL